MPQTSQRAKRELTTEQLQTLTQLAQSRSAPPREVQRAGMLCHYHEGRSFTEIAALGPTTRRLVEVCASLGQWLEPYRGRTGAIWALDYKQFHEAFLRLRGDLKIQHRRNGLRHSFVSAHYAMHGDEGRTAQQAGNSPKNRTAWPVASFDCLP
jgi:hypothetical protein